MKVSVKAKSLREGDKVELDDGTTGTVKHVKTHKKIIPRRSVEQTSIEMEVKTKKNGRSFVSSVHMFTHGDDALPIVDRKGYSWKWSKTKKEYEGYIHAIACACTGSVISVASAFVPGMYPEVSALLLVVTGALSGYLAIREYNKAPVSKAPVR